MDQVKFVTDSLGLCSPQYFKFFEGCLPQILLGLFLNTQTWDIIETYLNALIENQRFGNIGSSYKNKPGKWVNSLTLKAPTPQNGQTHSKNYSDFEVGT